MIRRPGWASHLRTSTDVPTDLLVRGMIGRRCRSTTGSGPHDGVESYQVELEAF